MPSKIFQPGLLDGQVAIVSGGGSGLGRAAALELASLGRARGGVRAAPGAARRDGRARPDGRVEAHACDIREEDQVEALVEEVCERHGRIDLLVNNAGGQYLAPAEDITPKGFRTVIRLNVEGTWLMSHTVATRAMIPGGRGGKIVNVTLSPHHGLPGMAHSSAARAAVENLTRVLSIEWARFGIRLTAVAPGPMATDTMLTKYPQEVVDSAAWTVPLGRLGTEEEFAWLVAYLASPAGDYLSGHRAHARRRARQLVRRVATGGDHGRGRKAAGGGAETEGVSRVPELRTERLLMRAWRDEDLDWFGRMMGDPAVAAALGHDGPVEPPQAWRDMAFLAGHWALKGYGHWVLEKLDTGECVGRAGLLRPPGWPDLEVGWTVAPRALGQRLRARGGARRVRFAHDELGARHIVSLILPENVNSIRVAEKLGERVEGELPAACSFDLRIYGADLPLAVRPDPRG